jgi:NAD(P) transhydrogenase subunit alpha
MKVAVLSARREDETRVAVSPDTVKKLTELGCTLAVESGAGERAGYPDQVLADAGAIIEPSREQLLAQCRVVLAVDAPDQSSIVQMSPGTVLVGMLDPFGNGEMLTEIANQGVTAMALELLPRITRAQSMDVLSSQSNLAGYKAVIDAAAVFGRAMPMMMTAAGTIPPARVLVMGAGVAGLQAIATARRLGAIVSATDVRLAAKEQVESLGATFVMVDDAEMSRAETAGGYAREMSESFQKAQAELIAKTIATQDIVICTALIPGRPAPRLITSDMVRSMKRGAVIVDLAVERGGNCELSQADEIVDADGVRIIGYRNMPGRLAQDASNLYARNLMNFLTAFYVTDEQTLRFDPEDEIVAGVTLTRDHQVVHPQFGAEPTANEIDLVKATEGVAK